jgi:hypothetical protein
MGERARPWLCIRVVPVFKVGDPRPEGYVERAEWARVQMAAGRRQKRCSKCGRWVFPGEPCNCGGRIGT